MLTGMAILTFRPILVDDFTHSKESKNKFTSLVTLGNTRNRSLTPPSPDVVSLHREKGIRGIDPATAVALKNSNFIYHSHSINNKNL
jgi:hypothetical protein